MPSSRPSIARHERLKWFAVWGKTVAFSLDVYPEEIERHRRSLKDQGFAVLGPFPTERKALAVAMKALPHAS